MHHLRSPRKILVTGGAGFIGSAFIRYLLTLPSFEGEIINLDLLTYAGNLENLAECSNDNRYCFVRGDVCDQKLLEKICRENFVDAIVHFAAESHVDKSIEDPHSFMETNVMGTFQLLEVVRKNPHIHFHHISTDEVYGSLGNNGLFSEDSPYQPSSPYSASKAAADHLVRAYGTTYDVSYTLSNCSNNYGPYQYPEKLIPLMITNCLANKELPVYGKGENVRDWLYVEDHAEAIWMIIQKGRRGESYNIGGESEYRNIDLIEELILQCASITGKDQEEYKKLIRFVGDRPGHDYRYAIDCSKIKKELGWSPQSSFQEGLRKTVVWYAERHGFSRILTSADI